MTLVKLGKKPNKTNPFRSNPFLEFYEKSLGTSSNNFLEIRKDTEGIIKKSIRTIINFQ